MSFDYVSGNKGSAVNTVVQYILYLIKENNYPPGTKLPPEGELCYRLDISRGTVREAMKMLHSVGIIEIQQGKGTFVAGDNNEPLVNPLLLSLYKSPWEIEELAGLREQMDILIYYNIIHNDNMQVIAECEEINQKLMEGKQNGVSNAVLADYDVEFHRCMAKCIDNPLLLKIYNFVYDFYESFVRNQYEYLEGVPIFNHDFHVHILDRLKQKDLNGATEILHENVKFTRYFLQEIKAIKEKRRSQ